MEFCEKCGDLMIPQKKGKNTYLVCRKCERRKLAKKREYNLVVSSKAEKKGVVVVEKKHRVEVLPTTMAQCPKCEFNQAYWWMQQTRAADEPPTRFFKCARCNHVWRAYE